MKSPSSENLIQIITATAVVIGLGLVIWELQQTKSLAVTQIVHGDFDNYTQNLTSIYGEDLNRVLATACFEPNKLDQAGGFVLDAYFDRQLLYIQRVRVQVNEAGFDSPWRTIARTRTQEILSFPQGRQWLMNSDHWYLGQPEFAETISSALESEVESCDAKIGTLLSVDPERK